MKNLALICLYGAIGTVEDWIVAKFYDAVKANDRRKATIVSFFHTLLGVFVVGSIIVSRSPWLLLSYAVGGSIGLYVGMGSDKHGR